MCLALLPSRFPVSSLRLGQVTLRGVDLPSPFEVREPLFPPSGTCSPIVGKASRFEAHLASEDLGARLLATSHTHPMPCPQPAAELLREGDLASHPSGMSTPMSHGKEQKLEEVLEEGGGEPAVHTGAGVPGVIDYPLGGRLARYHMAWTSASRWTKKVIRDGYRWQFVNGPPKGRGSRPKKFTSQEVDSLLLEYKALGAIERSEDVRWLSNIRAIPKSSGGHRLIMNLRPLNKCIRKVSYKLPSSRDLRAALPIGAWMVKVDIENAYFHVAVHPSLRGYLGFFWRDELWRFRVLPFGLTTAPAVFSG